MRKMFVLFVLALAVLAGLPAMAEAQSRTGGWVGHRGGYGRGHTTRQGRYGYDPRLDDPCFDSDQYFEGIRGNFHFQKKNVKDSEGKKVQVVEKHFHACDPSNQPVRMRETAGWYGAGGAVIGYVLGGPKGAAVGGVTGATVGAIKGDDHSDCFPVDSNRPDLTFGTSVPPTFQRAEKGVEASTISNVEQVTQPSSEHKIVRNRFEEAQIRVYEGSKRILELNAGSDGEVEVTSSSRIWGEAYLENTKNGKMEWIPLQFGKGIDSLPQDAGWVFGNPGTRPSLQ